MKRWQMTLGLAGAAVVAAALAPRLTAIFAPTPPPEPPPAPPVSVVEPVVVEPDVVVEAEAEQGRLIVDAGLDRPSVLKGTASERFLTISVRAPLGEGEQVRQPVNVAVVMDTSGSMSARGKIDYAKSAAKHIVRSMGPDDEYSLVTFNDNARVIVPATRIVDVDRISRQIDRIYEGGGTNLYGGMELGKKEVLDSLDAGEVGKLVILSDGKANVGVSDPDSLARFAAQASAKGISVTALGLGVDYREDVLARIADLGGGNYDFIDDPAELSAVFEAELQRTATVVARNTAITIDLPPDVEPIEVIGWDAQKTGKGWTIFMGDVQAGAERKIVARVRVTGHTTGDLDVAAVRADYTDLVDRIQSQSSDIAVADITVDPNRVQANVDREKSAAANRAWGNRYLEMSTRAYEQGDLKQAKKMLAEGSGVLRQAASSTGDVKLEADAKALELQLDVYEDNAPSSSEGRRAIKMNKEYFRDAYR
ncbi:MAG: VWA domain-containing protein [Alphaproteobacteria bacterium]|nr:VWA domain-containing protein [Alphaproteobacteria bacterium]